MEPVGRVFESVPVEDRDPDVVPLSDADRESDTELLSLGLSVTLPESDQESVALLTELSVRCESDCVADCVELPVAESVSEYDFTVIETSREKDGVRLALDDVDSDFDRGEEIESEMLLEEVTDRETEAAALIDVEILRESSRENDFDGVELLDKVTESERDEDRLFVLVFEFDTVTLREDDVERDVDPSSVTDVDRECESDGESVAERERVPEISSEKLADAETVPLELREKLGERDEDIDSERDTLDEREELPLGDFVVSCDTL